MGEIAVTSLRHDNTLSSTRSRQTLGNNCMPPDGPTQWISRASAGHVVARVRCSGAVTAVGCTGRASVKVVRHLL